MIQLIRPLPTKTISTLLLVLLGLLLTACGSSTVPPSLSVTQAGRGLDQVLNNTLQRDNVVNSVLLMEAPDHDYRYSNAVGMANPETHELMTAQHAFRIASVSKTFVATLVLQLVEEGYFTLDTPLSDLLEDNDLPSGYTLDDLHRFGGQAYGGTLTPRQLLQHTSGMRDFMRDGATDDIPRTERGLVYRSVKDLQNGGALGLASQQWNKAGLLRYYLEQGYGENALFPPGLGHHYSDSGYLVLGAIIEKVTELSLTSNLRQRLFTPLNLNHTYHEFYEAARDVPKAHHFFDLSLLGQEGNIDVEAVGANTSASWAGGGVVSTPEDILTFFKALFNGDLFTESETLNVMQTLTDTSPNYGLGLQAGTFNGYQVWGHTGFWGTAVACSPAKNVCLALATNQVNTDLFQIGSQAFKALLDAEL